MPYATRGRDGRQKCCERGHHDHQLYGQRPITLKEKAEGSTLSAFCVLLNQNGSADQNDW